MAALLQSGFLALLALLRWESHLSTHFPTHLYNTLFAIIGTVLLFVGLVLGALGINSVSRKVVWKRLPETPRDTYIVWVQRGVGDGEAKFTSHVVLRKIRDEILESHYRRTFERGKAVGLLSTLTVIAIGAGYVLQVIGVSGMHYPAQLTLFGITLIMTGIRVVLRPMPLPLKYTQTPARHEMDYLAVTHHLGAGSLIIPDSNSSTAPIWTVNGGQKWLKASEARTHHSVTSISLINLRNKIGKECRWCCPGEDKAISAARVIEIIAQRLRPHTQRVQCHVPIDLGPTRQQEYFEFTVQEREEIFTVERRDLISALSLWLFYDEESKKQQRTRKHLAIDEYIENDLTVFFLGPSDAVRGRIPEHERERDIRRRIRHVRLTMDEQRVTDEPRLKPVNVKRNLIAGFQDVIQLYPPSFFYNLNKATVQLDIDASSCSVQFSESTAQGGYAPALVEKTDIATLYSRHLISTFMWAVQEHINPEEIDLASQGRGRINMELLWEIADDVSVTGLVDAAEAMLLIVPPLQHRQSPTQADPLLDEPT